MFSLSLFKTPWNLEVFLGDFYLKDISPAFGFVCNVIPGEFFSLSAVSDLKIEAVLKTRHAFKVYIA